MFNCLVVDDEPIARDIIINYCSHLPQLRVLGSCGNVFEAKDILLQHPIDILFLDVHMPVLDGIGFLRTLKTRPQVIFITAYKEYAVDAFELSACDYLVKIGKHTSELQSQFHLVCRLLLEKKKK